MTQCHDPYVETTAIDGHLTRITVQVVAGTQCHDDSSDVIAQEEPEPVVYTTAIETAPSTAIEMAPSRELLAVVA